MQQTTRYQKMISDWQLEMYRAWRQWVGDAADLFETPKTEEERAAVARLLYKMRSEKQD